LARIPPSDPRAQTPLPPLTLYVLLSLLDGERHGYGIIKEVEAITEARTKMLPGTLYRLIKQLLAEGWIVEVGGALDDADAERRRYYRLTRWGRRITQAEIERLADIVRIAHARKLNVASALR
jgi:DNA-binding PadR family transcriptional regulator